MNGTIEQWVPENSERLLQNEMPELFASVPSIEDRFIDLSSEKPILTAGGTA